MTAADAHDDRTLAEILDSLPPVKVRFWKCLIPEHTRSEPGQPIRQTVEWRGDVAHCLHPGCELTSEHTARFAATLRRVLAEQLERDAPEHEGAVPHSYASGCRRCGMLEGARIVRGDTQ